MIFAKRTDQRRVIYKAADPAKLSQIEALANKLQPSLAKAILAALQQQAANVDLDALAAALETGDATKVFNLLSVEHFDAAAGPAHKALNDAVVTAGTEAAKSILPTLRGVAFRFNQLNPQLIDWLRGYSLSMIQQISDGTREGVRTYLMNGMQAGQNPRTVAQQVKQIIGLTDNQAQAVLNFRRSLENFHLKRTAGGWGLGNKIDRAPGGAQVFKPDTDGTPLDGIDLRRLRDFRYDGQLRSAMQSGKPLAPAQIDKMVDAYSRKYLKYRAETIARTEAMRTTNVGVQEAWRQAVQQGKVSMDNVRRKWVVADDERLCQLCAPIPDMNPDEGVGMEEPFQTPDGATFLPPLHPNCRCTVFITTAT